MKPSLQDPEVHQVLETLRDHLRASHSLLESIAAAVLVVGDQLQRGEGLPRQPVKWIEKFGLNLSEEARGLSEAIKKFEPLIEAAVSEAFSSAAEKHAAEGGFH